MLLSYTNVNDVRILQSVLEGYNGTVMAYGQTGTGKTFTLGRLGDEDTAARGIMVRAMEDILADITPETDTVSLSYLQVCDAWLLCDFFLCLRFEFVHSNFIQFSDRNSVLGCRCSCIWK